MTGQPMITNIAAYQFARLEDLKAHRDRLKSLAIELKLKGTILLSSEGINLFVAGSRVAIDALLCAIRSIPGLENLTAKFSLSYEQPFTRMLVKIKKEIISFGIEGIDPVADPAPKIPPRQLKEWLDEGRPITLLDTRNEFEIDLGTFQNALPIGIDHFRDFPAAVAKLPQEMKTQPIVMFCTGGIRCEKAGPFMKQQGFEQVFQLEGGILKYFEECGREHYEGECFVFDKRVGLDPELNASGRVLCFACQAPLSATELRDPRFVEGVSCPHCFATAEDQRLRDRERHQLALDQLAHDLPGRLPYENLRPLIVSGRFEKHSLIEFLCTILPQYSREFWRQECSAGRMLSPDKQPVGEDRIVQPGERYFHIQPLAAEPEVNARIRIIDEDAAIIVVNKPAPLPTHPCGRFNKNTLQSILRLVYAPQKPRPAHRLDANTTGVAIFTRNVQFARLVQTQFERGTVSKRYLARVHGHPAETNFHCSAPIRDTPLNAGARDVDFTAGQSAHTDFQVLVRFPDGTSLVEAIPRTGRTNQIRIHLWHLGFPIMGDPLYLKDGTIGQKQTLNPDDPPLCLHAHRLELIHPLSQSKTAYEAEPPDWARPSFPS